MISLILDFAKGEKIACKCVYVCICVGGRGSCVYLCGWEGVQGEGWWWRSQYYWNNKKIWNIGWFFLSNMFWMFWRTSLLPRKFLNTYRKHLIALIFATVAGARCTFPLNIVLHFCAWNSSAPKHMKKWKKWKSHSKTKSRGNW